MTDWNASIAAADACGLLRLLMSAAGAPDGPERLNPVLTGPSVLRGARDLSEWGRNHRAVRAMLSGALERFFEHGGRGVGEAFSAEVLYGRGLFAEALDEALAAAQSPIPKIACTGCVLAARIAPDAADGHLARAQAVAGELGTGLEAAKARIAACRGDAAAMEAWLEANQTEVQAAGDPASRYLLLARGFVLIALGRAEQAGPLYDALSGALRDAARPLDYAEALCGAALARGDAAPVRQAQALLAPYRDRMLCAEFGEPMARLLETEAEFADAAQSARDFSARWRTEPIPAPPAEEPSVEEETGQEERKPHTKGKKRS